MKKILVSLMTIALVAMMAVGGAFAYFYDTETSDENVFAAGTLDLKVDEKDDPLPIKWKLCNLNPGQYGEIIYDLKNVGTKDGILNISGIKVDDKEGADSEPEKDKTGDGELSKNIWVILTIGDGKPYDTGDITIYNGLLSEIKESYSIDFELDDGESADFVIHWVFDKDNLEGDGWGEDVGNDSQGDEAKVELTFELNQDLGD